MPLSPRFYKLVDAHRIEVEHLRGTLVARTNPHDEIDLDHDLGVVTFRYRGRDLWQGHAILLGRLHLSAECFEWFADAVMQLPPNVRASTPEFGEMQLSVISEADAALLSDIVAHFRKASGVLRRHEGPYVAFYALHSLEDSRVSGWSARGTEWTVPPPAVDSLLPPATGSPFPTHPNIQSISPPRIPGFDRSTFEDERPRVVTPSSPIRRSEPSRDHRSEPPEPSRKVPSISPPPQAGAERPIREPERELVTPLAQIAVRAVDRALPGGFGQVLMTVVVDSYDDKSRMAVSIVASDRRGDLVSVENPRELFELVAQFLRADALSGNGRWSKLIIRVRPHPTKLVMGVEVR